MASVPVRLSERRGPRSAATGVGPPGSVLLAELALIVLLLIAGFAVVSSAVVLVFGEAKDVNWALYLLSLVALVPAAMAGGRRLALATESVDGPPALFAFAAWAAVGLLCAALVARLTYSLGGGSSVALLVLVAAWSAGLVWTMRSARDGRRPGAALLAGEPRRAWGLAALLACLCVLAFMPPGLVRPLKLGASLAIAGMLTLVHRRSRLFAHSRRASLALDAAVITLVVLTVSDFSGYVDYLRPDARPEVFAPGVVVPPQLLAVLNRIHEDFWLGPLNAMLHGRAMLVNTWSQYGVGPFYLLAAFFEVAPLGYGALGLLSGFLTALQYALAFGVMRIGGSSRTVAVPAIAAAVVGLVFGSFGSPNDFPSVGGLRFGIPWLIVALAALSARYTSRRRSCMRAASAVVGVAAIWSFETFVYTSAAFAAMAAFEAAIQEGERVRAFVRSILAAAGCCVVAQLILALATRAFAGSWPDWSPYLAYLKVYSNPTQKLTSLAVAPWSPGLLVGLVYLASVISVVGLLARRHAVVVARRPALAAIATASALGLASFTYFVGDISVPNDLKVVSLPAVVVGCLWVAVAAGRAAPAPRRLPVFIVVVGLWLAALLGISGWPDATAKWRRTALANVISAVGRGGSPLSSVRILYHSPPSDPRAPEAQALLDRYLPPRAPALVIVEPELTVETLVRSDRVNLLPISHPEQENLIPKEADPRVLAAIDRLAPGTLMLAQPGAFDLPAKPPAADIPDRLVRLQTLAVSRIRARFGLQVVEQGPSGLAIMRLVPRR